MLAARPIGLAESIRLAEMIMFSTLRAILLRTTLQTILIVNVKKLLSSASSRSGRSSREVLHPADSGQRWRERPFAMVGVSRRIIGHRDCDRSPGSLGRACARPTGLLTRGRGPARFWEQYSPAEGRSRELSGLARRDRPRDPMGALRELHHS